MTSPLIWFVLAQVAGMPAMDAGTEVRLVSRDLLTVYASARVIGGKLEFGSSVTPGQEVRLLIFPPGANVQERAAALSGAHAVAGRMTQDGRDIIVRFPELSAPVSFTRWLAEERGIILIMPRPEGYR